jgi:hypothetical protein
MRRSCHLWFPSRLRKDVALPQWASVISTRYQFTNRLHVCNEAVNSMEGVTIVKYDDRWHMPLRTQWSISNCCKVHTRLRRDRFPQLVFPAGSQKHHIQGHITAWHPHFARHVVASWQLFCASCDPRIVLFKTTKFVLTGAVVTRICTIEDSANLCLLCGLCGSTRAPFLHDSTEEGREAPLLTPEMSKVDRVILWQTSSAGII